METVRNFVVIGLLMMMGCKAPQPITSTLVHKADSVASVTTEKRDSSSYVERVTERVLPSSSVESGGISREQFDSLMRGLQALPSKSGKTIFMTDPKMQTMLTIVLDSIGRLHFRCTTAERLYYERSVLATHYSESLQKELLRVNKENSSLTVQLKEAKKPFWDKLEEAFSNIMLKIILIFIIGGLVVVALKWVYSKIRSLLPKRL